MGRIKINLTSGSVLDKPVVTSFKGTNGDYLIIDNETNGSMGLPIICVSKINGTELSKIIDPAEWNAVKDNLKTIIAGTNLPYLTVPEVLSASDDFYTQLTLPVASFDLLKNVYAPAPATPVETPAPVMPETPAAPEVPVAPVVQPSVLGTPNFVVPPVQEPTSLTEMQTPVMPDISTPVMPEIPVAPVMPEAPAAPAMPEIPLTPVDSTPVIPSPTTVAMPSIEPMTNNLNNKSNINYDEIKNNFMSACETMIDGLIEKLKNQG